MADDDPDDRDSFAEAIKAAGLPVDLHFVEDGMEVVDYLKHQGAFSEATAAPRPDLIFLDLNMPRLDGHGALRKIKADQAIAEIPVIVFTTSSSEKDIEETYRLGAQSHVTKPFSFDELVDDLREISAYWSQVARLPRKPA